MFRPGSIKLRQLKSHLDTNSSVTATNTNPCTQTNQGCMRLGWDGAKLCFYLLVSFEKCLYQSSYPLPHSQTQSYLELKILPDTTTYSHCPFEM